MIRLVSLAMTLAAITCIAESSSAAILTFGQVGNASVVTATVDPVSRRTTITVADAQIQVTQYAGAPVTPFIAYLNLSVTSTEDLDPINSIDDAINVAGNILQSYAGTFSITSLTGGAGDNYLSATFTDIFSGQGNTGTLQASDPPDSIDFTSHFLDSFVGEGIAFSFASVLPQISIDLGGPGTSDDTLAPFTASVSGTFSAERFEEIPPVPEPTSMAIWGLGVGGLGLAGYWRRRRGAV